MFFLQQAKMSEVLQANDKNLAHYITQFQWDSAKYSTKLPIRQITDDISKVVIRTSLFPFSFLRLYFCLRSRHFITAHHRHRKRDEEQNFCLFKGIFIRCKLDRARFLSLCCRPRAIFKPWSVRLRLSLSQLVAAGVQLICFHLSGSLLIRSLDDLVKKNQFVTDSEVLVTLVVVVPKSDSKIVS